VCRELTKAFEEVVRGLPVEVAARFGTPPKGEITLVLAPGADGSGSDAAADEAARAVAELVAAGLTRRDAAQLVSRLTSIPRGRLYQRSL
jgi:16S rRNA (cytidine1402-2'-O)-methyltransferase